MDILLLGIVGLGLIGVALCAVGIVREIKRPRTNFDDEHADQA